MSSPFVEDEYLTFTYPAPLDKERLEGETEEAYKSRQEKIKPDEIAGKHWIKFRVPRSRGDVDKVADLTASRVVTGDNGDGLKYESRIARGNKGVFDLLVDSWSWGGRPSSSDYDKLDLWAGDWVLACMAEALEQGTKRDWAEKNGGSSKKPEPSPSELPSPEPVESVSE